MDPLISLQSTGMCSGVFTLVTLFLGELTMLSAVPTLARADFTATLLTKRQVLLVG